MCLGWFVRLPAGLQWDKQLGSGAHKIIYKAWDSLDGKLVAWNVVPLTNLPPHERKRLRREVAILQTIRHERLIAIENTWDNLDAVVFITPIVESGDLQK
jgi:serine/threonine protein kinase